ncbi:HAD-IB family hydrolase [Spongiibacter sp. KMU-166]|uniref:1-acyl-sn-glycerol-3-phosphate acyltransferase n=1 Tax=Spongiibacter thalassae TaxID=2721624 RepID=A0ABX1GI92_9GAMM|nr:HAD-IB family hydrolase [Spongiibacter thalassae]NKI18686.1 HAD-IB family hydrolase [Spongiibacter thalassae]
MKKIKDLLADIEKSPEGPETAALFDFDGTIIAGYSATHFMREQIRRGDFSPKDLMQMFRAINSFGKGNIGFSGMMAVSAQFVRGIDEDVYWDLGKKLYAKKIAALIYPETRALIEAHKAKGHTVAIISSATPYQVKATADDLGIDHVLCTQFEVENGKFTGGLVRPTCFGQGKVAAAVQLAAESSSDLDKSFFYSDSTDDILLLEHVGYPRALNPNDKLADIAKERNWPVARFDSRGRPSVGQFVRSLAASSSLLGSVAAGLPIYAFTGSQQKAVNFSLSLFTNSVSAIVGLDLDVKGEEHLWSHRPAVFVFNHQSKADMMILSSLIREDITGIAKKEILKENPLLGKVMQMAGGVFIDRSDGKSAIEAMKPLVDAMLVDGKSVVIAPEGTRSVSPALGPFKKGAFHVAMAAGVPIVPIVIRNALDVLPKGASVMRAATVDVTVLPPVDTSEWSPETIDTHVRHVRNMFARTLGQKEESEPPVRSRSGSTKKNTISHNND